jgi:hypothetical protein
MQPPVVERQARQFIEPAQTTSPGRGPPTWLIALALAVLALLPRCLGLADFFTIDEPYHWIGRVRRFAEALGRGDWAATDLTGHPGVTTMWLGALGRWIGQLMGVRDLGGAGAGAAYLATLRLPLAVANGLAVVVGYLALRRLVRPPVAVLAGLLWATSPYLIAHSRLLHLDALLTSFMTLSVLLLLVGTTDDRRSSRYRDTRHETQDMKHETRDARHTAPVSGLPVSRLSSLQWSVVHGPWSGRVCAPAWRC